MDEFLTKVIDPNPLTMEDLRAIERYRDRQTFNLSLEKVKQKDEIVEEISRVNKWLKAQYVNIFKY